MKNKVAPKWAFAVVAILIIAFTLISFLGIDNYYGDIRKVYFKGADDIRWGIDIRGGVEAVFSPDIAVDNITNSDMDAAKAIIETRLVNNNITDYEVYCDNAKKQVIVRFPWSAQESDFSAQSAASAVKELGETAVLRFCEGTSDENVVLEGSQDIESAKAVVQDTQYMVELTLTTLGTSKFTEATEKLKGDYISIWMDDQMIDAPKVDEVITGNKAYISGSFTYDTAHNLADKINAGSLPFALTCDESKLQIISPSLGSDALKVMVIAGSVAFAVICILMIVKYRLPGVVAAITLFGQIGGMIACVSGFFPGTSSFTLTVPGIAGIILSIGVGVDANVIAAERIKEEFNSGKTISGAINSGFENSFKAILDGNITIIIVSIVLMGAFGSPNSLLTKIFSVVMAAFGSSITGSIYSFGYTLLTGVIFNFVMAVCSSRIMLRSLARIKAFRNPWLYGGVKNEK